MLSFNKLGTVYINVSCHATSLVLCQTSLFSVRLLQKHLNFFVSEINVESMI